MADRRADSSDLIALHLVPLIADGGVQFDPIDQLICPKEPDEEVPALDPDRSRPLPSLGEFAKAMALGTIRLSQRRSI